MGGRGSGGKGDPRKRYGKKEDPMNVPFDKWGEMKDEPVKGIWDKDSEDKFQSTETTNIGWIEDRVVYNYEPDIRPTTKKEALAELNAWKNDKDVWEKYGSYGGEDETFMVAYSDGRVVSDDELTGGKAFPKSGIVGISISTADYEYVWGGEIGKDGQLHLWETWNPDGEHGYTNSYSGYKPVSQYKVRDKVTWNNKKKNGQYYTTHEIIRKSEVVPYSW